MGPARPCAWLLLVNVGLVVAQQQCYYGPGGNYRGPSNLVPCLESGQSACCLQGDVCLSGNACWDNTTGDTYQYGCTDITYSDASCPFKCGWDPTKSPWTALEFCNDLSNVQDTWTCQSPESCGCDWGPSSWDLQVLSPFGCKQMGANARAALYAPLSIAPYLSLPATPGGSTGYYSFYTADGTTTWITTPVKGYTPSSIGPVITYSNSPTAIIQLDKAGPSTTTPTSSSSSLPSSTSSPTSSITKPTSSSTRASTSTSSTSSTAPTSTSPSGLSSGAKIGIGVGVGIGAGIFLSALTVYFLLARRRKRTSAQKPDSDSDQLKADEKRASGGAGTWQKKRNADGVEWGYDPSAAYVGPSAVIHEAPSPHPEMSALPKTPPAELDAGEPLYELSSEAPSGSQIQAPEEGTGTETGTTAVAANGSLTPEVRVSSAD